MQSCNRRDTIRSIITIHLIPNLEETIGLSVLMTLTSFFTLCIHKAMFFQAIIPVKDSNFPSSPLCFTSVLPSSSPVSFNISLSVFFYVPIFHLCSFFIYQDLEKRPGFKYFTDIDSSICQPHDPVCFFILQFQF